MFPIQCEGWRINHLTPLLVVTMPCACWFLWRTYYTERHQVTSSFPSRVVLWRVVLRDVYFEGPNRVWRALKTSILDTATNVLIRLGNWDTCKSLFERVCSLVLVVSCVGPSQKLSTRASQSRGEFGQSNSLGWFTSVIGEILGIIIGWDPPSVCKSNRLHVDILQFFLC